MMILENNALIEEKNNEPLYLLLKKVPVSFLF
jgi:hypothetical protein